MMATTQMWCHVHRLDLSFIKSKIVAFFETPKQRRDRAHLPWTIRTFFPTPSSHTIDELDSFLYLGTTLDSTLSFRARSQKALRRFGIFCGTHL